MKTFKMYGGGGPGPLLAPPPPPSPSAPEYRGYKLSACMSLLNQIAGECRIKWENHGQYSPFRVLCLQWLSISLTCRAIDGVEICGK